MGDDALLPPPKPSGCLRRSCGCVAGAAALLLVAAAALAYALSGWTPGRGAWNRLPGDTLFALEANNVERLLEAASEDAGALSLAGAALRAHREFLIARGVPAEQDMATTLHNLGRSLSWFHTVIFPNYVLLGARSPDAADMFLVMQPPRWFAWTAGAMAPEGRVDEIADDEGNRVFAAFRDGFVIAGLNRDIVGHVAENWDGQAMPFGERAASAEETARGAAYCAVAARREEAAAVAGAPFLSGGLAGGFARRETTAPAAPGEKRFLAVASPGDGGWNVRFAAGGAAELPDGGEAPEVRLPDASDLEAAARVTPEAVRAAGAFVAEKVPPEWGGDWLRHGILDRAAGAFTLLASRPVAVASGDGSEEPPYPPLPVVRAGWSLGSSMAPAPFANFLRIFVDGLPVEAARSLVSLTVAEDGLSGEVSLPGVFANGARPAWRFLTDAPPMTGWLATDPAGLPDAGVVSRLAANRLPAPADGRASVAVNWDMSRAFIEAAEAVVADRAAQWGGDGVGAARAARALRRFLTAYPRGAAEADVAIEKHEARGRAFVPFGMDVAVNE